MSKPLVVLAVSLSALALYLPTRTQAFTRVTVDGHSMRMLVAGSGPATVVFESGGGAGLEMWGKVQPAVSRFARTVSYDRAGMGLSEKGPLPRDSFQIATELHDALRAAGISPPYILAGASMGGLYVRRYAGMYPDDVAGLVLVDPTSDPEQLESVPSGMPVFLIDAISPLEVPFTNDTVRAMRAKNRPEIETDSIEYQRWLAGIPGGHLIVTHDSGHNVAIELPELVVSTIRQAVDESQKRPRSSARE